MVHAAAVAAVAAAAVASLVVAADVQLGCILVYQLLLRHQQAPLSTCMVWMSGLLAVLLLTALLLL
jgi:hypothetical protein